MGYPRRRSFRRRSRRIPLIALLLPLLFALHIWRGEISLQPPAPLEEGTHAVRRVVDGDTLLLADGKRIRLIGVDTPESVKPNHPKEPFGDEATRFTRDFIGSQPVRLEFDRERIDQYDRYLAYVWIEDRMLNEELVRAGLARVEREFRYSPSVKRRLSALEAAAKQARRGIWSLASMN